MNTVIWMIVLFFVWFLPVGLATKKDRPMIFVITLFTSWTGIGWVVALAMAVRPRGSSQ